ncbi:MAG: nucleoside deaminase, partial [Gammaproteobacteria bacterium]|nr:nucleoside deaminase [Gammaproteobacteria bacterium]
QQLLHTYDLGNEDIPRHELVSSCKPCTMCLGAILWSGIRRLTCAARDEDARAIGFDEGPRTIQWQAELEQRGIEVITDVQRDYAKFVMKRYLQLNGEIYNPHRD